MIVDIPDKDMRIEFPDDMDTKEVERQILMQIYDRKFISQSPEPTGFIDKAKDKFGDIVETVNEYIPEFLQRDSESQQPPEQTLEPTEPEILERVKAIKPDQPLLDPFGNPIGEPEDVKADLIAGGQLDKGALFGDEMLPEGIGYPQKPVEKVIDFLDPYLMTPEDEKRMSAKYPNLMAARYASASLLLPGISEKIASPTELEEFVKLPPELQRVEIATLAGEYAAFGAVAKGVVPAIGKKLIATFPWLTNRSIVDVFRGIKSGEIGPNWLRKLNVKKGVLPFSLLMI